MCAIVEKKLRQRKRYGYMFLEEVEEFKYRTPVGKNGLRQGKLYDAVQNLGHILIKHFHAGLQVTQNSFHIMKRLEDIELIKKEDWGPVNTIVLVEIPKEAMVYKGVNYGTSKFLDGKYVYLTSQMRILGHIKKKDPETKKWKKVNTKKEILSRIH